VTAESSVTMDKLKSKYHHFPITVTTATRTCLYRLFHNVPKNREESLHW